MPVAMSTRSRFIPAYFRQQQQFSILAGRTAPRSNTTDHGCVMGNRLTSITHRLLTKGDGYRQQLYVDIERYRDSGGIPEEVLAYNRLIKQRQDIETLMRAPSPFSHATNNPVVQAWMYQREAKALCKSLQRAVELYQSQNPPHLTVVTAKKAPRPRQFDSETPVSLFLEFVPEEDVVEPDGPRRDTPRLENATRPASEDEQPSATVNVLGGPISEEPDECQDVQVPKVVNMLGGPITQEPESMTRSNTETVSSDSMEGPFIPSQSRAQGRVLQGTRKKTPYPQLRKRRPLTHYNRRRPRS